MKQRWSDDEVHYVHTEGLRRATVAHRGGVAMLAIGPNTLQGIGTVRATSTMGNAVASSCQTAVLSSEGTATT